MGNAMGWYQPKACAVAWLNGRPHWDHSSTCWGPKGLVYGIIGPIQVVSTHFILSSIKWLYSGTWSYVLKCLIIKRCWGLLISFDSTGTSPRYISIVVTIATQILGSISGCCPQWVSYSRKVQAQMSCSKQLDSNYSINQLLKQTIFA